MLITMWSIYRNINASITIILYGVLTLCHSACKKLVETPVPPDQIANNITYSNDATAIAVLTAIYTSMSSGPFQGSVSNVGSVTINAGLAADEFSVTEPFISGNYIFPQFYKNDLGLVSVGAIVGSEHWGPFYNLIFRSNAAIEGLSSAQADLLTPKVRSQLIGEAKFVRALIYFYLINEFGGVPLVLTTDPEVNSMLARSDVEDVYAQVVSDLVESEEILSNDYLDITLLQSTVERVRPTKWAAKALLARVYLYMGDYTNAEIKASEVLNNTSTYSLLPLLNSVFLKNSREAIWQIQPTDINRNTREGLTHIIPPQGPVSGSDGNPVYLSKILLNSFEFDDDRCVYGNWVDTVIYKKSSNPVVYDTLPFSFKYKISSSPGVNSPGGLTEYFMMLRLSEQYLIRAEAKAQLGNINAAQADLNAIRTRAGLPNTTANDEASLIAAILNERRVELFAELGHRWFDLKRTGHIDAVMNLITPIKSNGSPWRSFQQLFPIPIVDINTSPNLVQNPGY